MQDFVEQCVDTFCVLENIPKESWKNVKTPFIVGSKDLKDWEILLEKDCGNEDDSPNRNTALDVLGEEIKNNRRRITGRNQDNGENDAIIKANCGVATGSSSLSKDRNLNDAETNPSPQGEDTHVSNTDEKTRMYVLWRHWRKYRTVRNSVKMHHEMYVGS